MTISERIFQRMEEKKLTQKEFSQATGIAQSTICDWRRKGTNPASDKIMIICHCLDMDPVDLLSGTENRKFVQPDYLTISKDTEEYQLVTAYREMDPRTKARLSGYLDALKEG